MKNGMPEHYWRIHKRVATRLLTETPPMVRTIIAADVEHETPEFKWFEKRVTEDAQRLFNDEGYYDNDPERFRHSMRRE